jgi:hypothetical protein
MILHTYSITNDKTNDLGLIPVPQALSACTYRIFGVGTLIGNSDFKKKHVELFFIYI